MPAVVDSIDVPQLTGLFGTRFARVTYVAEAASGDGQQWLLVSQLKGWWPTLRDSDLPGTCLTTGAVVAQLVEAGLLPSNSSRANRGLLPGCFYVVVHLVALQACLTRVTTVCVPQYPHRKRWRLLSIVGRHDSWWTVYAVPLPHLLVAFTV